MKCFRHQELEAVGICKACHKGICSDCSKDLGHSISCKGPCEKKAALLEDIITFSQKSIGSHKNNSYIYPVFVFIAGVVFFYFGLKDGIWFSFAQILGLVFMFFGVISFYVLRKFFKDKK